MGKYVNSEATFHLMNLLQLGADVHVVSGKMVYVQFNLENGSEVAYVYHINKNEKYFLERIKPYPLPIKELESPLEVINLIKIALEQQNIAKESHNMQEFIDVNLKLYNTMKSFEDLFLYYNVPKELMDDIDQAMDDIQAKINDSDKKCKRIYFEKEPDNL